MNRHGEDMDAKRLASVTADAVSNVLFFHTKHNTPPAEIRRSGLEHAINAVFHLRSRAADIAVAHLEIACDAAVTYALDYNELHLDNTINPRWMYLCVQALLSYHLKPALMEDGKVQRLLHWVAEHADARTPSDSQSNKGPALPSAERLTSPDSPDPSETLELDMAVTSDDDDEEEEDEDESSFLPPAARRTIMRAEIGGIMRIYKTPWTDVDIRRMIELRAQGLTHLETSEHLNRGKGAVENKYGRVVKEMAWKPYVAQCEARFVKVRRAKRKVPSEPDKDEVDEEEEEDEAKGLPVAKKRKLKLAVTADSE